MNVLDLSKKLFEHYECVEEVKNYYGLLAIYALLQTAEESEDQGLLEKCKRILYRFPSAIEHPRYNFPSYTIGGIAKAYAFMKGYMPDAGKHVREYADEMMVAARDRKGIMCNPWHPEKELIWIDTAMAVTPYLLFAGLAFNEERYIDEAANQAILMYEELLNPDNGLIHQCKNFIGPGKYSEDHWARGNGWAFFALTELIRYLPEDSKYRSKAVKYFKSLSEALLPYQSKRGLWRQEIPFEYSYEETSGTSLFLYGFGAGMRLGILEKEVYMPVFIKGIQGLCNLSINEDFSTSLSCPGCLCPGEDEEKGTMKAYVTLKLPHKNESHSFGTLMFALVEAFRNGITNIEKDVKLDPKKFYG